MKIKKWIICNMKDNDEANTIGKSEEEIMGYESMKRERNADSNVDR